MGLFDKLRRFMPKNHRYAQMLNGYTPIFSQFGTNIYASDVVQQALKCIVDEMSKLKPMHIRRVGNDYIPVNDSLQHVLENPNPLMTTSEFLEKTMWLLLLNYNVFILPTYYEWEDEKGNKKRYFDGLYPLKPTQVDFIEDVSNTLYVKLTFENNFETTIAYSDIIHIRYNFSVNEFMGGDETGQPDHSGILSTLQLNKTLLEGIAKAMKASYAVNGVVKANTMIDGDKKEAALRELEEKLKNSESGFLLTDLKSEFIPLQHDIQLVDEATLKFIDSKILRNWKVPLPILTGEFDKSQYSAFYQSALEPFILKISQAITKKVFTDREKSYGNEVRLYPEDLVFMTVDQTLEMVNMLSNTGALYENEKRNAFGIRPLPELAGKRYMSLNWVDVDIAAQYQLNRANGNTNNTNNTNNVGGDGDGEQKTE